MKKLKKISWLVVTFVGLFLAYSATANANKYYDEWQIRDSENPPSFIFTKNEHSEEIAITCANSAFISSVSLPDHTKTSGEVFLDYRIDNHSVIMKGDNSFRNWASPGIWYPDGENELSVEVDKYQTLFQQMLQAKQSLTVNLIDADGHIYRSASFSVKGLPEALIEFAKQCGTDFQTYSGIKINQQDNNE